MTNKYLRTIYGVDKEGNAGSLQVDVYDVLDAYPTRNPALDHLIKKALCPGLRGHKDRLTDLDDIIKSAQRAKQMVMNKMSCTTEVTLTVPDIVRAYAELRNTEDPHSGSVRAAVQKAEHRVRAMPPISAADTRPTCFDGKVLCYYSDKLREEGLLKTFQELAQKAGVVTRRVQQPKEVGSDCILIQGTNPSANIIRRFIDQGIILYGVREANGILRGHLARDKGAPQSPPARGYKTAFDTRPTSFIGANIYIIEGIDEDAEARLEHEIAQVDVIPDYVRSCLDCPDGAIVIWPPNSPPPTIDSRWHFSVGDAISILINDQKGDDDNA